MEATNSETLQRTIAFDCDGTLLDHRDNPRFEVIEMVHGYFKQGWRIIIWSGGGELYARRIAEKLGLTDISTQHSKTIPVKPQVAVDDQDVTLGVINFRV